MKKLCPKCEELLKASDRDPAMGHCAACGWTGHLGLSLKEPLPPTPTPKMPYLSIDIETTGLDPDTCQVLEVGAVADDWVTPINQLPRFRRILRYERVAGLPFALALNAGLLKLIANPPTPCAFCQPEELGGLLAAWVRSCGQDPMDLQAAGKNFASFDAQFLKRLPRFGEHVRFRHRTLDPAILFWKPAEDDKLPDSKTCYERAGLDNKVAHTALEDALAVVRLVRLGIKRLEGMAR
jgi:oligoribonuclease